MLPVPMFSDVLDNFMQKQTAKWNYLFVSVELEQF